MKSIAFIRKALGKRDKNKISKEAKEDFFASPSSLEQYPDMHNDTPCPAMSTKGFRPPGGSVQDNTPDDHYHAVSQHIRDDFASFQQIKNCRKRSDETMWVSIHDPPLNAARGQSYSPPPPVSTKSSAGGSIPARPSSRPPPLYSHSTATKRPIDTGPNPPTHSPSRHSDDTIAHEGKVPSSAIYDYPDSSDERDDESNHSTEDTPRCGHSTILPDGDRVHLRRPADTDIESVRSPQKADCLSSSRNTHAVLDSSDSPELRRFYQASLRRPSTPHLSAHRKEKVPSLPPLRLKTNYEHTGDNNSASPLSLFPAPPPTPLFVRRKAQKALALRPATATIIPSPSSFIIFESNLPAIPKTSPAPTAPKTPRRPSTSPGIMKPYSPLCSPKSASRAVPPQLFNPPTIPLPTPPTSPRKDVQRNLPSHSFHPASVPSHKPLRTVKSTNQLRPEVHVSPLHMHRFTTSEPLPPNMADLSISQSRRRVQSRPELRRSNAHYPENQVVKSDSKVQVGVAF